MDQYEKIFHEEFIQNGGIYKGNQTQEDKFINDTINRVQELISKKAIQNNLKIPNIHVYCINNFCINACVKKIDDEYYMGIYKGTIIGLKDYINSLVEDKKIKHISQLSETVPFRLKDLLYEYCIEFLVYHEFSHIRFGHCDLIKYLAFDDLEEAMSDKLCKEPLFRQTLEYDADCCAIAMVINNEFIFYPNFRISVESITQRISLCMLSCFIVFNIFNKLAPANENDIDKLKHPLPGIRINYIFSTIFTILDKIYNTEETDIICEKSLECLFRTCEVFTERFDARFLKIAYNSSGINKLQDICDNWENVREMLLRFSYDSLAPYEKVNIADIYSKE